MKMRRKVGIIASLLLILCGVGVLLYPVISNQYERAHHGEVIRTYQSDVADMEPEQIENAQSEAEIYNSQLHELVQNQEVFVADFEKQNLIYEKLLNENADGVMSFIEIPCIDVFLPIYHGTSEGVLAKGAGHMVNTSLPVGGASTHCVISAHRGDPSATLFSNLDQLQEGDEFYLHTLNERLCYKVDQIKVVLPYETDDFRIEEGKDYVTLVTCTPYSVNSHRLLVRGERTLKSLTEEVVEEAAAVDQREQPFDYSAYGYALLVVVAAICIGISRQVFKRLMRKQHEEK